MNKLDLKINYLLQEIKNTSKESLFKKIKEKYFQVPSETRNSIENFFGKFPYWGTLNAEKEDFKAIEEVVNVLKNPKNDFQKFFADLKDYRSKKTLYAILSNWYQYDFYTLNSIIDHTYSHYFDLDIIPTCKDEIFVDIGAYTGDTIEELFNNYNIEDFKKIYAYEMSNESVKLLKEKTKRMSNVIVLQKALSNEVGQGKIIENLESSSANILKVGEGSIPITTLDEELKTPVTMIKMDIEGSEQKALLGSLNHLRNDKPKLMISIYHGFKDVIEIWQLIKDINPKYKFYLRYYGGPIFPTEIVLYAI